MKTIDITPTWQGLLPAIIHLLDAGNSSARKTAWTELERMAEAADKWNAHCKESKA